MTFAKLTDKNGESITLNLGVAQMWEKFVSTEDEDRDLNTIIWFSPDDVVHVKEKKELVDLKVGII